MKELLEQVRVKDFEDTIMAMLMRLINSDCYTSKITAISLFPVVYPGLNHIRRNEIMNLYSAAAIDEKP